MPARPSPTHTMRPPARRPRARTTLALLAASALAGIALHSTHARSSRALLPACDAPAVRERLADALEQIPALAGREARLLELDAPRVRGYAGRRPLRACQGRLVTSVGSGAIEYSIRPDPGKRFAIRPELFQGGWRPELERDGRRGAAPERLEALRDG